MKRPVAPPVGASALAACLGLALLAGCAQVTDRVVLLPEAGGKVGAVTVKGPAGEAVLTKAYEQAQVSSRETVAAPLPADEVKKRYDKLMQIVPEPPRSYVVYFVSGQNTMTPESQTVIQQVQADLGRRAAPELIIIGHTDRVGAVEANDRLALARAVIVRDLLAAAGLPAGAMSVVGRGEREPLVPTVDEIEEARNRRVEIKLR